MVATEDFFQCNWDVKFLELPDNGKRIFRFLLESGEKVTARIYRDGEARIFLYPSNAEPYIPQPKMLIGTLNGDGVQFARDGGAGRESIIEKYERWPECLKQMTKAYEVASVLFS
jgi:hypothetical protein